jgi:hypothetical protein
MYLILFGLVVFGLIAFHLRYKTFGSILVAKCRCQATVGSQEKSPAGGAGLHGASIGTADPLPDSVIS